MEKKRNQSVDVIRGIAMLMVVLGHTMSGCTQNSESSLMYNIIWSLQMPLFMIISGYVTKFSKKINTAKELGNYLGKRTLAYFLPFVVFSVLIRGLIMGQKSFLDIKHLVYHMDSGYWFLFSVWTITIIFGFSQFFSGKILKKSVLKTIGTLGFCVAGAGALVGVAMVLGMSFLCIKLTLYYIPFYLVGFLFGQVQEWCKNWKKFSVLCEIVVAISAIAYMLLITRYNTFELGEGIFDIGLRATISLLGCISVCGLVSKVVGVGCVSRALSYVGSVSLEIYLVHYMFLSLLQLSSRPEFNTIQGIALVIGNYLITLFLTLVFAKLLSSNKYLKLFLFGKRK